MWEYYITVLFKQLCYPGKCGEGGIASHARRYLSEQAHRNKLPTCQVYCLHSFAITFCGTWSLCVWRHFTMFPCDKAQSLHLLYQQRGQGLECTAWELVQVALVTTLQKEHGQIHEKNKLLGKGQENGINWAARGDTNIIDYVASCSVILLYAMEEIICIYLTKHNCQCKTIFGKDLFSRHQLFIWVPQEMV